MSARLSLKKGGLSYSFTTRNLLLKPQSITMELIDGPFDSFQGQWLFNALATDACKVHLQLTFQLSSAAAGKAAEKFFESIATNLVNSLCQRANLLYD